MLYFLPIGFITASSRVLGLMHQLTGEDSFRMSTIKMMILRLARLVVISPEVQSFPLQVSVFSIDLNF